MSYLKPNIDRRNQVFGLLIKYTPFSKEVCCIIGEITCISEQISKWYEEKTNWIDNKMVEMSRVSFIKYWHGISGRHRTIYTTYFNEINDFNNIISFTTEILEYTDLENPMVERCVDDNLAQMQWILDTINQFIAVNPPNPPNNALLQ